MLSSGVSSFSAKHSQLFAVAALAAIGLIVATVRLTRVSSEGPTQSLRSGYAHQQGKGKISKQLAEDDDHELTEAFYRESLRDALKHLEAKPKDWAKDELWFLMGPFHVCPRRRRIGTVVDGGKWICDTPLASDAFEPRPCQVYSLGSSGWVGFEKAILRLYPHCTVHTFDHTLDEEQTAKVKAVSNIAFHPKGIASNGQLEKLGSNFTSISDSMAELKIDWLDILKMDIEGAEWPVLMEMFDSGKDMPFTQVLIEIHVNFGDRGGLDKGALLKKFFMGMLDAGYRIFSVEPNYHSHEVNSCFEYSFIKVDSHGNPIRPYPIE